MGRPYSPDLRKRFVALLGQGFSARAAGCRLLISAATATRWGKTWRTEKRAAALPMGGDRRSGRLEAHASTILDLVRGKPDLYLSEIIVELSKKDIAAKPDALSRLLIRHGITRKKRQ